MSFHKSFPADESDWVRNPEWLTMPSITSGDHKFAGLFAVFPEGRNDLALSAAGNYTVDWGDGSSTEDINSGVTAQHSYTYTDTDLDDTTVGENSAIACTFTDTGDTVDITAHGWQNGQIVQFATIVTTTGISTETPYYIVNAAANTFQVASTLGGSAIALTTDGSGTVFLPKYKQVIVEVTMQSAQTFTALYLDKEPTVSHASYNETIAWLDITVCGSSLTTIDLGGIGPTVALRNVERVTIIDHNVTSLSYFFYDMYSLQSVPLFDTSSVTSFTGAFSNCRALRKVPAFDMTAATACNSMFSNCYALREIGAITTDSSLTNCDQMFSYCRSLKTVPLFDTSNVSDMDQMFRNCETIIEIPAFDFSSVTSCDNMFNGCYALRYLPDSFSEITTDTVATSMFASCYSLTEIPAFDSSSATAANSMFSGCWSLRYIPAIDLSGLTSVTSLFANTYSVTEYLCDPPEVSFTVQYSNLDANALDALYTNLATVSSQTITVTGNPGTSGDDPSIATAKGWTVTG